MIYVFIYASYGISGAEIVLKRFLDSVSHKENYHLIIVGDNSSYTDFFEDLDIASTHAFYRDGVIRKLIYKVLRKVSYGFFLDIVSHRVKKTGVFNEILRRELNCTILANNTMESAIMSQIFDMKKHKSMRKIAYVHDIISRFRTSQRNAVAKRLQFYDSILTVSEATKKSILDTITYYDSNKIHVIHNSYVSRADFQKNNHEGVLKIGFIGAAIYRKGFDVLVNALNKLDVSFELHLLCHMKSDRYLRNTLSSISFNDKLIHHHEKLPNSRICEFIRSCDLIIVPSRWDPLPTVILESISCGVNVMGASNSGIPEMIISESMLYNDNSSDELALKIKEYIALDSDARLEMFTSQREYFQKYFTLADKVDRIEKVLHNENCRKN